MSGVVRDRQQRLPVEATPASSATVPATSPPPNGPYVTYTAVKNETALQLCERFGIHYSDLVADNAWLRQTNGHIKAGQLIYIPNPQSGSVYIVKPGDTLGAIASKNGVDLGDLRDANRGRISKGYIIQIGQVLVIPSLAPVPRPRPELLGGPEGSKSAPRPMANEGTTTGVSISAPRPRPMPTESTTTSERSAPVATPASQPTAQIDASGLNASSFGGGLNPYRVRVLQRMLNRAGASIAVDGDLGGGTRAAIHDFQTRNNLPVARGPGGSAVNTETWAALEAAANRPVAVNGVRFALADSDLSDPKLRSAHALVSALAHDDPNRLSAMLQTDRAHDSNGDIVVDRGTLGTLLNRIKSFGFALRDTVEWTYDEARSVADMVSGVFTKPKAAGGLARRFQNDDYDRIINRVAKEEAERARQNGQELPADFDFAAYIKAMIAAESSFVDGQRSMAGRDSPYGLMQIKPSTARELGVRDISSPENNIRAGARYILAMQRNFVGRNPLERDGCTAGAYNCGPGNMPRALTAWRETRHHAQVVTTLYALYRATDEPRAS